jgi:4-amino-4-deoxy-L-arabinose transferase-like glycosyltransferase/membrane-associated phospholipid phosphatase
VDVAAVPAPARAARRAHAVPLVVAALAAAALAAALHPSDGALEAWLAGWNGPLRQGLDGLLTAFRPWGKGEVAVVAALVVAACGQRRAAARALIALLIVAVAVAAVKHGVGRLRPNGHPGFSFPSGDAATAAALAAALWGRFWPSARRWAWGALFALVAVGVAWGRVQDGYHHASDAAAGLAVGMAAALVAGWCVRRWMLRPRRSTALAWAIAVGGAVASAQIVLAGMEPDAGPGGPTTAAPLLVATALCAPWLWWWHLGRRARRAADPARTAPGARAALGAWLPGPLALGAIALGLFALLAASSSLWDRDEPRFARAGVEMLRSGDWTVPTFNVDFRLHKPAGIYWLMAPAVWLFGQVEWAVRLPAVLAALATSAMTWCLARRADGDRAARWAAIVLLANPLMLFCGSAATTDSVLLLCMSTAIALFAWRLLDADADGPPGATARPLIPGGHGALLATLAAGIAIGAAQLVKGPLGLAVPALAVVTARCVLRRPFGARFWLAALAAAALGVVLFLAWAIPANHETNGQYLAEALNKHLGERLQHPMESHGGAWWWSWTYYFPVLLVGFCPWVLLLPAIVRSLWSPAALMGPRLRALVVAWALPTFLLMTLIPTKLPHYVLPILPALAIAVGVAIAADARGQGIATDPRAARWLDRLRAIAAPAGMVVAAVLALAPWLTLLPGAARAMPGLPPLAGLIAPTAAAALLMVAGARVVARDLRPGRLERCAANLLPAVAGLVLVAAAWLLPAFETWKPARPLAWAINRATAPGVPVTVADYDEASLHYYLDRDYVTSLPVPDLAVCWYQDRGPGVLVITDTGLERARAIADKVHLPFAPREIARASGINLANGRWITLVALARGPQAAPTAKP